MNNPSFHTSSRRPAHRVRGTRCVALVDARFIDWLSGKEDTEHPAPRREGLRPLLENALEAADLGAEVGRIYWYTSEVDVGGSASAASTSGGLQGHFDSDPLQGQVVRWVAPESVDTGVSLVLAMARDLYALAAHGACEQVLVASDDDRLLPVIDYVQSCGLRVCLLADESLHDVSALARTDPAWASVLSQADARVLVSGADLERCLSGSGLPTSPNHRRTTQAREDLGSRNARYRQGLQSGAADEEGMRSSLGPMVAAWWVGLDDDQQSDLARQLPEQRGLPQEADRSLLLHLSQQLGRPLTLGEKKLMREMARDVVAGSGVAGGSSVSGSDGTQE